MSFVDGYSAENSSESENSGLEGEEERDFPVSGIEPYMFEPEWSSDDERADNPPPEQETHYVDDEPRRKNLDWYVYSLFLYKRILVTLKPGSHDSTSIRAKTKGKTCQVKPAT